MGGNLPPRYRRLLMICLQICSLNKNCMWGWGLPHDTVSWLCDSVAPAGTALPRALLALQSSWGMSACSTEEEQMWVTAGSPPAGMLRGRRQGECIGEQFQFFLGSLLGRFFRDQEKKRCCWRAAVLLHPGLGESPSWRL